MQKNPIEWTVSEVLSWLSSINCVGAHEIFQYHSIEGKDLLQITDTDLRFDFKIKRVHDRKYLLRCIQDLKNSYSAIIEVEYSNQHCSIRISDINTYTFDQLRRDTARNFGIHPEKAALKDKKGVIWGSVSVAYIFDSNLRQQEPVFLENVNEIDNTEEFEEGSKVHTSNISENPWFNDESGYFKNTSNKKMFK